jgi:HK97 gp10 family phage protein
MNIEIQGLSQLIDIFVKAKVELPKNFKNAMINSVNHIRDYSLKIVPVDTGALKKSITTAVEGQIPVGRVMVGQPYGIYVEYGTRKMRAQPYIRPSLEMSISYINDQFSRAIQAVLAGIK